MLSDTDSLSMADFASFPILSPPCTASLHATKLYTRGGTCWKFWQKNKIKKKKCAGLCSRLQHRCLRGSSCAWRGTGPAPRSAARKPVNSETTEKKDLPAQGRRAAGHRERAGQGCARSQPAAGAGATSPSPSPSPSQAAAAAPALGGRGERRSLPPRNVLFRGR